MSTSALTVHAGSLRYHRQLRALRRSGKPPVLIAVPGWTRAAAATQARSMAASLGRSLQRVDLRRVAGKYIGETEKNLRQLLDRAEAEGVLLFFDEADALFGKRTEVRDAHDRYANQEISYLISLLSKHATVIAVTALGQAQPTLPPRTRVDLVVRTPVRAAG